MKARDRSFLGPLGWKLRPMVLFDHIRRRGHVAFRLIAYLGFGHSKREGTDPMSNAKGKIVGLGQHLPSRLSVLVLGHID
jgi:hypothetical protein